MFFVFNSHQLCSLLKVKPPAQLHRSLPVDRAFEAANDPDTVAVVAVAPQNTMPTVKPKPSVEVSNSANSDDHSICCTSNDGENGGGHLERRGSATSRYEIPDDKRRMSGRTARMLANRREVEMSEFRAGRRVAGAGDWDDVDDGSLLWKTQAAVPDADPAGERDSPVR